MAQTFEAVVIGAGVMGSATAYYLSKKYGSDVALLERFDFLHRRGSSHGDSRITRLTYPQDYYTFLMRRAHELWHKAEQESGTQVFLQTGGLDFATNSNPGIQALKDAAKKWDVPHEILTPAEVNARFPTITLPENYTAVYSPESGVLKATKAVSMFQNLARKNGCNLQDNVEITGINVVTSSDSGEESLFEIRTNSHGTIKAKKCVLTAGAWTQKILDRIETSSGGKLGLTLPLEPRQTTAVYWEVSQPQHFSALNHTFPVFISYEHAIYGLPALEFPNAVKCASHHGVSCDPDARDFHPGTEKIESDLKPFNETVFVGLSKEPLLTESCMYTVTPDEDYIIDRVPGVPGLYLGAGFSGHGFKMAPIVGTMLAGFVSEGENPFSTVAQHFRIDRF